MKLGLRANALALMVALGPLTSLPSGALEPPYLGHYGATSPHRVCVVTENDPPIFHSLTIGTGCTFNVQGRVGETATVQIDDATEHPVGAMYSFRRAPPSGMVVASGYLCGGRSLIVPEGADHLTVGPATILDGDSCGAGTIGVIRVSFT